MGFDQTILFGLRSTYYCSWSCLVFCFYYRPEQPVIMKTQLSTSFFSCLCVCVCLHARLSPCVHAYLLHVYFVCISSLSAMKKFKTFVDSICWQVLRRLYDLIVFALKFSLDFSSRPPTDFSPHQKILWNLDAWSSEETGNSIVNRLAFRCVYIIKLLTILHLLFLVTAFTKLSSFTLELWFSWHKSLWTHQVVPLEVYRRLAYHMVVFSSIIGRA